MSPFNTVSPLCPKGEWPRSCASAMVSARSVLRRSALERLREMAATSFGGGGRGFNRVCEPRAQMIAGAVEENLRLVFEPAERARVDDAVAVALELRAPDGRGFLELPSACGVAELREGREDLAFDLFELWSRARHGSNRK